MLNSGLDTDGAEICREAVPVLEIWKVWVAFWPTMTVWKLKELAERERPGMVFFWMSPTQPMPSMVISNRLAIQAELRRKELVE